MLYDPKWEQKSEVATALIAARKLIERRKNWLNCCPSDQDEAHGRFCAARAIWRVTGAGSRVGLTAMSLLERQVGGVVPEFNDSHTHAEVLAAFDKAISAA